MPTGCLPSLLPTPTLFPKNMTTIRSPFRRSIEHNSVRCKAASSSPSSTLIMDFDLYDLLGVDCSSDQSQIKTAYRTLQKRCHPDIVGPPGHDMAIVLNEAYRVLSDPTSRSAYDQEQAKISELLQSANAKNINEVNTRSSEETDFLGEARLSAIQAIRSISYWLDWESPIAGAGISGTLQNIPQDAQRSEEPNIEKLREAAAAWKQASENPRSDRQSNSSSVPGEEYGAPSTDALTVPIKAATAYETERNEGSEQSNQREEQYDELNPVRLGFPMVTAIFAATVVRLQAGSTGAAAAGRLTEQTGGSLLEDVVNSYWLQTILAGVTWYLIGLAVVDLAEMVRRKKQ